MSLSAPLSTPFRCPTCHQAPPNASGNSKNLVVFIDGTSNKSGSKETNVKKLYDALPKDDVKQLKCYYEGIGAYDDHLPLLNRMGCSIKSGFDMAFARTVGENVMKAYLWLARNYREGDRLYLFGYSRGGYQVRALAGLIHEVGLLQESGDREKRAEQAYRRYISINPNNPKTKEDATQFKKDFCYKGVRVHLVGVWDTVSSLGLVKTAVHITASASVTNACHFRHALALDERRVKFMPEYFSEVNAHRSNIRSRRAVGVEDSLDVNNTSEEKDVGDVKEVWFAGSHSDVGGISRPAHNGGHNLPDNDHLAVHSGNVPLVWMRREATAHGLLTEPETSTWHPEDIDVGRRDTMKWCWRILEVIRTYHQISFSGTGKHARRKHGYRPRSIIPAQHVHSSAFPGCVYVPLGTLTHCVDVPAVPPPSPGGQWPPCLWTTELPDEESMITRLTFLLNDRRKAFRSLGEILFLLDLRLSRGQTQIIPEPDWLMAPMDNQSNFDKFALTVIHDVACTNDFNDPREQDMVVRNALKEILSKPDHSDFRRVLYVARLSARHPDLRKRFIAHTDVIQVLVSALEEVPKSRNKYLFPFVTECLRYVIDSGEQRTYDIRQLTDVVNGKTRVLLALEVKAPNHLVTSLEMIASLARYTDQLPLDKELEMKITALARQERSPVGAAAVEALVAFNVPIPHDVHISGIIYSLGQRLPRLDAEIDNAPFPESTNDLPSVLQADGSGDVNRDLMEKLLSTAKSWNAHLRTAATLTLLKLCHISAIRGEYSRRMLDIFMSQLERQKTSLLAAYALMVCLKYNMWMDDDFSRVASLIVSMMDKGWFDDAVGRVEGSKIFGEFMASNRVGPRVLKLKIVDTLQKQLEGRDYHKTRMSLICLEGYWKVNPKALTPILKGSLVQLGDPNKNVQKKGARILSALARTKVGEEAIVPLITEIVGMLLPPSGSPFQPCSQLFGPVAAVYNLCKNETLRRHIEESPEYETFLRLRNASA